FRSADDLAYTHESLATLGDSLALFRRALSVSGVENDGISIGAATIANVVLVDVDGQGLRRCTEVFADDRLGDAIARLYERYGETLSDGPARTRAAATARTAATVLSMPRDPDRYATMITS